MPSPVIVSLDFETDAQALDLVERLGDEADHYKIGLQLLTGAGPGVVRELVRRGKHVRIAMPAAAARAGATYVVIGRAIAMAQDPARALRTAQVEFGEAPEPRRQA